MKRKLPRFIDMIVTRKDREAAAKSRRFEIAADGRMIVHGEPLPLDRSAIVMSAFDAMAQDRTITYDGAVPLSTD